MGASSPLSEIEKRLLSKAEAQKSVSPLAQRRNKEADAAQEVAGHRRQ